MKETTKVLLLTGACVVTSYALVSAMYNVDIGKTILDMLVTLCALMLVYTGINYFIPDANIGRPISECNKDHIVIVWDDYHGFAVARFNLFTDKWMTDLPYAFEVGGKEIELDPVLFWPLPDVPKTNR